MQPRPASRAAAVGATLLLSVSLAACGDDSTEADTSPSPSPGETVTVTETPSGSAEASETPDASGGATRDLVAEPVEVTWQEAIIAADEAVGANNATLTGLALDYSDDHGVWAYTVEMAEGDQESEVELDATTGKVLQNERETTDDVAVEVDPTEPLDFDAALAAAGDLASGPLSSWSLTSDDGRVVWEFELGGQDVVVDVVDGTARLD